MSTTTEVWTAAQRGQLLDRHQPYLLYDALETYFADAAEEWTRNPANRLRRRDGAVRTAAEGLSLDDLAEVYADGVPADPKDAIECTRPDYAQQYRELRRADPGLRNVMYGRTVETGTDLWLQYWFWYFLNDYQLAFGIDVHEGDWEMVQLRIPHGEAQPTAAVYAQHTYCEVRAWEDVGRLAQELEREGLPAVPEAADRPLVYVGRGSHASFFEAGYHETDFYDLCDGKQVPQDGFRLVDVTDAPGWLRWPGHWGSTRPPYPGPSAPCRHVQWDDPEALLRTARRVHRKPPPGAPQVTARQQAGLLTIDFDAVGADEPPAQVVVTVNCSDDKGDPPHAVRVGVADVCRGTFATRVRLDPRKHYDVRVATVDRDGRPTVATIFLFDPPNRLRGLLRRLGSAAGRLVFAVRRVLHPGQGQVFTDRLDRRAD